MAAGGARDWPGLSRSGGGYCRGLSRRRGESIGLPNTCQRVIGHFIYLWHALLQGRHIVVLGYEWRLTHMAWTIDVVSPRKHATAPHQGVDPLLSVRVKYMGGRALPPPPTVAGPHPVAASRIFSQIKINYARDLNNYICNYSNILTLKSCFCSSRNVLLCAFKNARYIYGRGICPKNRYGSVEVL
jgi:hypothetical protein